MDRKKSDLSIREIELAAMRKYELEKRGILYADISAKTGDRIETICRTVTGVKTNYAIAAWLSMSLDIPFRRLWGREATPPTPRRREMLKARGLVFCPENTDKPFRSFAECAGCKAAAECGFSAVLSNDKSCSLGNS